MGLLSRLKDISTGKLLAFLEEAEDPELIIPQLLHELYSQQKALHNAEAKSLAAVRAAQRKLDETLGRALRLERGAELALKNGEEETAKEALREQVNVEATLPTQRDQVAQSQSILDNARERSLVLKEQIALLKEKKNTLKNRPTPTPQASTEPLLRHVAQMEEKVLTEEAELEARREVFQRRRSLDERLLELEKNDEIETRLKTIKQDLGKDSNHDS